jgi:hypothetical protein
LPTPAESIAGLNEIQSIFIDLPTTSRMAYLVKEHSVDFTSEQARTVSGWFGALSRRLAEQEVHGRGGEQDLPDLPAALDRRAKHPAKELTDLRLNLAKTEGGF